jgi:hypothetical protein
MVQMRGKRAQMKLNTLFCDAAKMLALLPLAKLSRKQASVLAVTIVALLLPFAALFFKVDWQHIVLTGLSYFFVWLMPSRLR